MRLRALDRLPERRRRLIWLQGLGFSYAEMAGVTGDSPRTVERQLRRARQELADLAS
jgi:DNA-directed RNA polymerase specialized sigma24 family protein